MSAEIHYKDVEENVKKPDAEAMVLWKDIFFDILTPTLAKKRTIASEKERLTTGLSSIRLLSLHARVTSGRSHKVSG